MILVYCTFPSNDEAKSLAKKVIENKLAACAHITNPGVSIYSWNNEICEDSECVVFFKTQQKNYSQLEKFIKENHSYDVPCVFSISSQEQLPEYFNWVKQNS